MVVICPLMYSYSVVCTYCVNTRGVELTHRNVLANIVQMKALDSSFNEDTGDVTLALPDHQSTAQNTFDHRSVIRPN